MNVDNTNEFVELVARVEELERELEFAWRTVQVWQGRHEEVRMFLDYYQHVNRNGLK
jgi:tetrahydromethanopterin S-methyltransferase subunit G